METILGDIDRARGIYELAVCQSLLDMPEVVFVIVVHFVSCNKEQPTNKFSITFL